MGPMMGATTVTMARSARAMPRLAAGKIASSRVWAMG